MPALCLSRLGLAVSGVTLGYSLLFSGGVGALAFVVACKKSESWGAGYMKVCVWGEESGHTGVHPIFVGTDPNAGGRIFLVGICSLGVERVGKLMFSW